MTHVIIRVRRDERISELPAQDRGAVEAGTIESNKTNNTNKQPTSKKTKSRYSSQFEIIGFDEIGYPDYLEYGKDNAKVVLSWWKFRMKRKSDGKMILLPIHYSHRFNNE